MMIKKLSVNVDVEIDLDYIIESIVDNLDPEDIINFIKRLESECGDWDFTLELYDYFKAQKKIFDGDTTNTNNGIWRA